MFDSISTLAVASNMRELYRLVLVDTPLAPYFSESLTAGASDSKALLSKLLEWHLMSTSCTAWCCSCWEAATASAASLCAHRTPILSCNAWCLERRCRHRSRPLRTKASAALSAYL